MKYEFLAINNFIVTHASAEHFDADLKLYRKLFPESRILNDLANAQSFQKRELDERMLFEILNADRICLETIQENRGIIVPKGKDPEDDGKGKEPKDPEDGKKDIEPFIKTLLNSDIDTLKYNELKALIFGLGIEVSDQKAVTLRGALIAFKGLIPVETLHATSLPPDTTPIEEKKS